MQAQISEIITIASAVLSNPLVLAMLTVAVAAVAAVATGLAGRLAVFVEDLSYSRRNR
jgi:hypothetical protein